MSYEFETEDKKGKVFKVIDLRMLINELIKYQYLVGASPLLGKSASLPIEGAAKEEKIEATRLYDFRKTRGEVKHTFMTPLVQGLEAIVGGYVGDYNYDDAVVRIRDIKTIQMLLGNAVKDIQKAKEDLKGRGHDEGDLKIGNLESFCENAIKTIETASETSKNFEGLGPKDPNRTQGL